ncbi:MAG: hypothetical protein ABI841_08675 [Chloroflexota bacterium]
MRPPRSVIGLWAMLIVISALLLLSAARSILGYFESAQYDGVATRMSLVEYLLERPQDTLLPPFVGLMAAIAAAGVFGGRRWARPLAAAVGVATILGGAFLLLVVLSELGLPGSFAILFLPPALLALLVGAFVVYAALRNAAYLSR